MNDQRAAFEAAWCGPAFNIEGVDLTRKEEGYSCKDTNLAWEVWQAAIAQPRAPISDEPIIDGHPLWSGLPPPAKRAPISDAQIFVLADKNTTNDIESDYAFSMRGLIQFARALMAAQGDAPSDAKDAHHTGSIIGG